jgi:hypothetical protein
VPRERAELRPGARRKEDEGAGAGRGPSREGDERRAEGGSRGARSSELGLGSKGAARRVPKTRQGAPAMGSQGQRERETGDRLGVLARPWRARSTARGMGA